MARRRTWGLLTIDATGRLVLPTPATAHPEGEGDENGYGHFEGSPEHDPSLSSHGNNDLANSNMWRFDPDGGYEVRGPHPFLSADPASVYCGGLS